MLKSQIFICFASGSAFFVNIIVLMYCILVILCIGICFLCNYNCTNIVSATKLKGRNLWSLNSQFKKKWFHSRKNLWNWYWQKIKAEYWSNIHEEWRNIRIPPGPVPKIRRFKDIAARFSFHILHRGEKKMQRYNIFFLFLSWFCIVEKSSATLVCSTL